MEHRFDDPRLMRRPEVLQLTGVSSSTLDRNEAAGNFPRRRKIGRRCVGWPAGEVYRWLAGVWVPSEDHHRPPIVAAS